MTQAELRGAVGRLLDSQLFCILATMGAPHSPHLSIVSFIQADDLGSIAFVTPRNTRKFQNMRVCPEVALFFDDRRPCMDGLMDITGVEARGFARELLETEKEEYRLKFVRKYPELAGFVDAGSSVMIRVGVESLDIVDHFQNVLVLPVDRGD